jgi:hypothetical protein
MSASLGSDDTAEHHHRATRITGLLEGNRKDRVRLNGLWPDLNSALEKVE